MKLTVPSVYQSVGKVTATVDHNSELSYVVKFYGQRLYHVFFLK